MRLSSERSEEGKKEKKGEDLTLNVHVLDLSGRFG